MRKRTTSLLALMVLLTLLMYPTFFNVFSPFKEKSWGQYVFSFSLFVLATCSASTFFISGCARSRSRCCSPIS